MTAAVKRRPLPALIALVALLALTAVVWVRVLNRGGSAGANGSGTPCPSSSSTSVAPAVVLPNPKTVDVLVLNSTSRTGIAATARRALLAAGFLSSQVARNDSAKVHVKGIAEIRYGPRGAAGATLLRYYFPGATPIAVRSSTSAVVTVSLGAAYKGVAPPASVEAAIKGAKATVSGASPSPSASGTCAAKA